MNDEIKEILEYLKDSQYIPSDDNRTYKLLDRDDTRQLLDYITNLQQEKKDYKYRCEKAYEELTHMSSSDYVKDYDIKQNCWIKLSNILQNGSENDDR